MPRIFNLVHRLLQNQMDVMMVPESFSRLAEMASPAVVNIRTVKTIKGGGPVFRNFQAQSAWT